MPQRRHHPLAAVAFSLVLLGAMACSPVAAPAPAVTLRVTVRAPSASNWRIPYDYVVANAGADAIYLPTCNSIVRPDFALELPGGRSDEISGTICLAVFLQTPVRLAGRAQLAGQGEVQRIAGTRYTPTLRYSMQAAGSAYRTAAAEPFLVR